jgi:hypothetical protein
MDRAKYGRASSRIKQVFHEKIRWVDGLGNEALIMRIADEAL